MQDGAPPYAANLTQRWCIEHFPRFWRKVEWPGNSPDLTRIGKLWSRLKDRVGQMANATKLEYLILQVKSAWAGIDPDILENLICSMHAKIQHVLDRNGGYTGK
ncbi:hypothetical protein LOD99_8058 [Oopsacas minuta]|uniref:Transposase n=1 Tax=Oopsacas minuta TaxID=111878 RepID=A0AAV7JIP9_9METZ|nr:hypothetical protein LOD99_8058 [Oopsacas minuta]